MLQCHLYFSRDLVFGIIHATPQSFDNFENTINVCTLARKTLNSHD